MQPEPPAAGVPVGGRPPLCGWHILAPPVTAKPVKLLGIRRNPFTSAGKNFLSSASYSGRCHGATTLIPCCRQPKRASLSRVGDSVEVNPPDTTIGRR